MLALTAEKGKQTLLVGVTMRGGEANYVKVRLNVNTRGGLKSDPEYFVDTSGNVTKANGVDERGFAKRPERVGQGAVTTAKRGKLVRFSIPLRLPSG